MAYRCPNCTRKTNITFTWTKPQPWYCEHCGSLLSIPDEPVNHIKPWYFIVAVIVVVAPFVILHWLTARKNASLMAILYFVFLLLFMWIVRRFTKARVLTVGLPFCKNCGYDLRGNTSGQCPECGSKPILKKN